MFGTRKLGKTSTQRKALLRQQVTDLLENGKMETTFERAKEVQPVVEKMITLGKKSLDEVQKKLEMMGLSLASEESGSNN